MFFCVVLCRLSHFIVLSYFYLCLKVSFLYFVYVICFIFSALSTGQQHENHTIRNQKPLIHCRDFVKCLPLLKQLIRRTIFKPFWKDQNLKATLGEFPGRRAMCHVNLLLRECPQLGMPPKTKRKSLSTKAGFPQSPWADRVRLRQHFHSAFGADQNGGKRIWHEWSLENRVSMLTYHTSKMM